VSGPALELEHVSAAYGPFRALFDVSFSVPAGGAVALVGPNGAGKSTIARVVSGLVGVTRGEVLVDGAPVTGWPPWAIARAGLSHVPEGRGCFADLTVEENLALAFRRRAGPAGLAAALERAYEAFPALADRRRQRAGTLSGGQQRLLSLAPALVVAPRVLVADELSLGLSPAWIDTVYEGLAGIRRAGTALLIVEQQIDRALALADEAVVLERGRVVALGSAAEAAAAMDRVIAGQSDALSGEGTPTEDPRGVRRSCGAGQP
jgi:branched-chain amino acid transport system ATP-binding protein